MSQHFQPVTDPVEVDKLVRAQLAWFRFRWGTLAIADAGFLAPTYPKDLFQDYVADGSFGLLLED